MTVVAAIASLLDVRAIAMALALLLPAGAHAQEVGAPATAPTETIVDGVPVPAVKLEIH